MNPFVFTLPARIVFGSGLRRQLVVELPPLSRPVLLTGRQSLEQCGEKSRILDELTAAGLKPLPLTLPGSQPECAWIEALAVEARQAGCDGVIAVGGGSVLDAGKALALLLGAEPGIRLLDLVAEWRGDTPELPPRLPLVLVPTTAATGSEANCGMVLTDGAEKLKFTFFHPRLYADLALVDPELTLGLSLRETCRGVFDIFCHLLEPYLTRSDESPVTAALVEGQLGLLPGLARQLRENPRNLAARESLSLLSLQALSGLADLGFSGVYPIHDLAAPLSARFGLPHADALARVAPALCRHNAADPACAARQGRLARLLFGREGHEGFVAGLCAWLGELELPASRCSYRAEDAERMAFDAVTLFGGGGLTVESPCPLDLASMIDLYREWGE